jgi:formiminoglutamase
MYLIFHMHPGVSAPSASGIQAVVASEIILKCKKSGKLITADIAELNPSLDHDNKTARLAAQLSFEILTDS